MMSREDSSNHAANQAPAQSRQVLSNGKLARLLRRCDVGRNVFDHVRVGKREQRRSKKKLFKETLVKRNKRQTRVVWHTY